MDKDNLVLVSYLGGYLSAMNTFSNDKNVAHGSSLDDIVDGVREYCRRHLKESGHQAILEVLVPPAPKGKEVTNAEVVLVPRGGTPRIPTAAQQFEVPRRTYCRLRIMRIAPRSLVVADTVGSALKPRIGLISHFRAP
jgi:hypothetical protein